MKPPLNLSSNQWSEVHSYTSYFDLGLVNFKLNRISKSIGLNSKGKNLNYTNANAPNNINELMVEVEQRAVESGNNSKLTPHSDHAGRTAEADTKNEANLPVTSDVC